MWFIDLDRSCMHPNTIQLNTTCPLTIATYAVVQCTVKELSLKIHNKWYNRGRACDVIGRRFSHVPYMRRHLERQWIRKSNGHAGLLYELIILYDVKGCSFTGYTVHVHYLAQLLCLPFREMWFTDIMQMYTRPINKRFQLKQDALKHAGTVGSSISEKVLYTV